jgi:hypothetical protein
VVPMVLRALSKHPIWLPKICYSVLTLLQASRCSPIFSLKNQRISYDLTRHIKGIYLRQLPDSLNRSSPKATSESLSRSKKSTQTSLSGKSSKKMIQDRLPAYADTFYGSLTISQLSGVSDSVSLCCFRNLNLPRR